MDEDIYHHHHTHHIFHYLPPPSMKSAQVSAIVMGFREAIKEEEEREKEQLNDWRFDFSLWEYLIWPILITKLDHHVEVLSLKKHHLNQNNRKADQCKRSIHHLSCAQVE